MKYIIYSIITSLLVSSCTSMYFMNIDVQKPAEITFPQNIVNVTFVNNTAAELSDTTNTMMLEALTQFINERNYFDTVSLYNNYSLYNYRLTDDQVMNISDSTDADAIISLDQYQLTTQKTSGTMTFEYESLALDTISVYLKARLSVLAPNGNLISNPIRLSDSLYWVQISNENRTILLSDPFPSVDEMLKEAATYTATKLEQRLLPYWDKQVRWIYTSTSGKMTQAAMFVKQSKWNEAGSIWIELYNKEKKAKKRAKLASNLAVAYEMQDNMSEAYDWISIAEKLFPEKKAIDKYDITDRMRATAYRTELARRVQEAKVLDAQF